MEEEEEQVVHTALIGAKEFVSAISENHLTSSKAYSTW